MNRYKHPSDVILDYGQLLTLINNNHHEHMYDKKTVKTGGT